MNMVARKAFWYPVFFVNRELRIRTIATLQECVASRENQILLLAIRIVLGDAMLSW
jgi:hypothetical protein